MRNKRRMRCARALTCVGAAAGMAMAAPVMGEGYPTKPVRLVVPFPPGGGTDLVGRTIAQALGERLGQSIIVATAVADDA